MKEYEEKFLVINWKYLEDDPFGQNFSEKESQAITYFKQALKQLTDLSLVPNNKYYVCNQDEPYAQKVIDIILGV